LLRKVLPVVPRVVAVTCTEASAVDPDKNCFLGITRLRFRPDVDREAVLAEFVTGLRKEREDFEAALGDIEGLKSGRAPAC
jgi:hypothetical protein